MSFWPSGRVAHAALPEPGWRLFLLAQLGGWCGALPRWRPLYTSPCIYVAGGSCTLPAPCTLAARLAAVPVHFPICLFRMLFKGRYLM